MATRRRTKEAGAKIHLALSQLYERHGKLTPTLVVKAAEDAASPLHSEFTWDNDDAARHYRLAQARRLIRSVEVKVTVGSLIVAAPAYVRSPKAEPQEQGYISMRKLEGNTEAARQTLRYETQRARAMVERARNIATVLDMLDEFNTLLAAFEAVERRLVA